MKKCSGLLFVVVVDYNIAHNIVETTDYKRPFALVSEVSHNK
jgi:hypothetical protein